MSLWTMLAQHMMAQKQAQAMQGGMGMGPAPSGGPLQPSAPAASGQTPAAQFAAGQNMSTPSDSLPPLQFLPPPDMGQFGMFGRRRR